MNTDGFVQESARAGRDMEPATCILYYNPNDSAFVVAVHLNISIFPHLQTFEICAFLSRNDFLIIFVNCRRLAAMAVSSPNSGEHLREMMEFCQDLRTCRHQLLAKAFGEYLERSCESFCDNCLKLHEVGSQCHPQPILLDIFFEHLTMDYHQTKSFGFLPVEARRRDRRGTGIVSFLENEAREKGSTSHVSTGILCGTT